MARQPPLSCLLTALICLLPAPALADCRRATVSIALSVPDIKEAQHFYAEGFGMRLESTRAFPEHGLRMSLLCGKQLNLELLQSDKASANPRATEEHHLQHGVSKFGIRVDNLDAFSARLQELGAVQIVAAFHEQELGLRIAVLADPFGNAIQLSEIASGD